jgi:(p)ppGpp synthase/HD superfamily hydrolase
MLTLTIEAHKGQVDKGGTPYILHPLAVMSMISSTDDIDLLCIALGHDLLEDTEVDYVKIRKEFGERVADGILALTKEPGEPYEFYKDRVKASPDAVRVKICDLTHNMDLSRLGRKPTDYEVERYERYAKFKLELLEL